MPARLRAYTHSSTIVDFAAGSVLTSYVHYWYFGCTPRCVSARKNGLAAPAPARESFGSKDNIFSRLETVLNCCRFCESGHVLRSVPATLSGRVLDIVIDMRFPFSMLYSRTKEYPPNVI